MAAVERKRAEEADIHNARHFRVTYNKLPRMTLHALYTELKNALESKVMYDMKRDSTVLLQRYHEGVFNSSRKRDDYSQERTKQAVESFRRQLYHVAGYAPRRPPQEFAQYLNAVLEAYTQRAYRDSEHAIGGLANAATAAAQDDEKKNHFDDEDEDEEEKQQSSSSSGSSKLPPLPPLPKTDIEFSVQSLGHTMRSILIEAQLALVDARTFERGLQKIMTPIGAVCVLRAWAFLQQSSPVFKARSLAQMIFCASPNLLLYFAELCANFYNDKDKQRPSRYAQGEEAFNKLTREQTAMATYIISHSFYNPRVPTANDLDLGDPWVFK